MPTFLSLHTETVTPSAAAIVPHRLVGFDHEQASAAGQTVMGVARSAGPVGSPTPVDTHGRLTVEAGGPVAIGTEVATDAQGRAIAATAGAYVVGVAMTASAGAGAFIEILR